MLKRLWIKIGCSFQNWYASIDWILIWHGNCSTIWKMIVKMLILINFFKRISKTICKSNSFVEKKSKYQSSFKCGLWHSKSFKGIVVTSVVAKCIQFHIVWVYCVNVCACVCVYLYMIVRAESTLDLNVPNGIHATLHSNQIHIINLNWFVDEICVFWIKCIAKYSLWKKEEKKVHERCVNCMLKNLSKLLTRICFVVEFVYFGIKHYARPVFWHVKEHTAHT